MGKKFESPAIVSLSLEDTEGSYATKGSGDERKLEDEIVFRMSYDHHNTGSLSVVRVNFDHNGPIPRSCLSVTYRLKNGLVFSEDPVCDSGIITNVTSNSFTHTYWQCINPNSCGYEYAFTTIRVSNGPTNPMTGHKGAMDLDKEAPVALEIVSYTVS